MKFDIKNRVLDYIYKNQLVEKGDKIVVGVSGGPDSMCLLNLLNELKSELEIDLAVAHINHMLRGEDADADEEYVKRFCNRIGIQVFSKRIDILNFAKDRGMSTETAGREVRYRYFEEVMNKLNFNKVATAHNANDQVETILMRIMRGTGLEGLTGIPVKREDKFIRPILFLQREEIEKYCSDNELEPRIDESNLERTYSRNKVRIDMIPYMRDNFNPDIIETINRMATILQEDNEFIQDVVNETFHKYCEIDGQGVIIRKGLFEDKESIVNRVIRKAVSIVSGSGYNIELKHIQDVRKLSKLGTNKKVDLPSGVYVENIYGDIYVKKISDNSNEKTEEVILSKEYISQNKKIVFNNYNIEFDVISGEKNINFEDNNLIKYFNYDMINGNIIIRYRKNGDKVTPLGMKGSKKLKDIFINMKIPVNERDYIPIIQFDEAIGWVVGVKVSNDYRVTNETRNILKITITRKEK